MNTPEPTGSNPAMAPAVRENSVRNVATAATLGGTPLAIVSVMLWESYTGVTLDSIRAAAIGSVGAGFFGYFWHYVTRFLDRQLQN